MLVHTAQVRGRKIAWDKREVVQHGLNADRIKFDLDAEFRCCDSYQVVLCGPSLESPKRYIPDKDMTVAVPPSLMESTGPVSTCLLGYVGGEVRVVTAQERYPLVVVESGFTGPLDPGEEQPDLWAQIMSAEAARIEAELVREAAETARADAEAKRIAAEKARETASAEAVKAANEAAAKAEQAARQAEDRVTAALAEVAKAEQARTEAEKARAAAESSRAEAEAARIAAESKRESAEAKRKADSAKAVADASAATSAANAAAGKADAAAQAATDGEASRVAAETARAKAEQARETAEAGRVEAEKVRVTADAERGRHVDASVKKADAATAEATEAAGKATASATEADAAAKRADEAAKGASENVLVGTETATVVHVEDAWPTLLRECKVLGKSEQTVTTGKNLLGGERYVFGYNIRGFKNILKPNTQYTYSSSGITDGKAAFRLLAFNAQQSKGIGLTVGYIKNASETFTTPENIGEFEELYLGGNYSEAGKNCINSHFQIEEGAKATAYEPFTGGKPSPRPDFPQPITSVGKAEVVTAGKNLLDPTPRDALPYTTNGITYSDAGNGMVHAKGTATEMAFLNLKRSPMLKGGCTYVLSQTNKSVNFGIEGLSSPGVPTRVDKDTSYGAAYFYVLKGIQVDAIVGVQLEVGSAATPYAPHVPRVSTAIDLQGHELRSLPNGVRDEVVVDREGNASLVQRVGFTEVEPSSVLSVWAHANGTQRATIKLAPPIGGSGQRIVSSHYRGASSASETGYIYPLSDGNAAIIDNRFTDYATAQRIIGEERPTIAYQLAEPQTIPLGKVSVPALPESTSNVWNADAIQTEVSSTYVRDVNIAFSKLESKLTQAVVAAAANL